MSMLKKTKEFFGLAPYEAEHEDAYYADEPRYEGTAAYAPEYRERDYGYAPEAPALLLHRQHLALTSPPSFQ